MKPLFTLVAAIAALFATGQHYCGFDAFKEHWLSDAHHASAFENCEQQVYQQLLQKSYRGGGEYVIPVVVHIIHQNGSENIPDEQVENAIEALNQAFANSGEFNSPEGTSVPIQFCLAQIDPEGNATSGIVRVVSPLTITTIPDQDSDLKATSFWDSHLYMNIWVIKSLIRAEGNEGIVGNATLPASHGEANDGVIVEAAFFGAPGSLGKVLVHETGHYLGLFHTFEGGCANSNCMLQGDRICDTPPDALGSTLACFDDTNSCTTDDNDTSDNNPFRPVELGGLGDQPDLQINYMDYSPPTCTVMFTEGQAERMLASLVEIRSSLLEGNRCSGPCSVETVANVVASEDTIALGSDVAFTNLSTGFTSATWYVDENIVSTDEDFVFSADATGNYFIEVLLANDEPGCTEELEFNIVVICPAVSEFSPSGLNIVPGETLVLDNLSVGATEYSWLLDGVEFSTSTDETLVFDEPGIYQVCLEAGNGSCTTLSCYNVNAGACATGQENAHWVIMSGDGGINHYIFSQNETVFDSFTQPGAENKATISDANGNLLFYTNGIALYNAQQEVTPNGAGLLGGISSRMGAIFVKDPGAATKYYLFTTGQNEEFGNGLRYSLIDTELDGGTGDIVSGQKNLFITTTQTETQTAIRHCNYRDFWHVIYNLELEQYEARLVDPSGVSATPVVSPYPASNFDSYDLIFYKDFKVSPKGDLFQHDNTLFAFDAGTGVITPVINFAFDLPIYYDFSPSGRYLYIQTGELDLLFHQIDVTLPAGEMLAQEYVIPMELFSLYSDIQRTPAGEIFLASVFSGSIDVIRFPNLQGENMTLEYGAIDGIGFTNSMGNYFHAYGSKPLWLEGPENLCMGQSATVSVYGCPNGDIEWAADPSVLLTPTGEFETEITFTQPGTFTIQAAILNDCGYLFGDITISVTDAVVPDLGPDVNVCESEPLVLDAGSEFESYLWNNGTTDASLTVAVPGTYSVQTTDSLGCTASDTVVVQNLISGTINLGPDFNLCDSLVVVLDAGPGFGGYQWQDGSTGQYYTVYEPGTYSVIVSEPCVVSDEIQVVACGDTIVVPGTDPWFEVYPNPSIGYFIVHLNQSLDDVDMRVYDDIGRLVKDYKLTGGGNFLIDASSWAAAVYYLKVSGSGLNEVRRVVVY